MSKFHLIWQQGSPDATKDSEEVEDPLPSELVRQDSTQDQRDHRAELSSWSRVYK
jgi:hypothetical protein